jgi:hypothetical protein
MQKVNIPSSARQLRALIGHVKSRTAGDGKIRVQADPRRTGSRKKKLVGWAHSMHGTAFDSSLLGRSFGSRTGFGTSAARHASFARLGQLQAKKLKSEVVYGRVEAGD